MTDYTTDPLRTSVVDALRGAGAERSLINLMVYAVTSRPLDEFATAVVAELESRGLRLALPPQVLADEVRVTVLDNIDRQCTAVIARDAGL